MEPQSLTGGSGQRIMKIKTDPHTIRIQTFPRKWKSMQPRVIGNGLMEQMSMKPIRIGLI